MARAASRVQTVVTALSIVAAAIAYPNNGHAAGAAYAVDTAEVSEVGACKVEVVGLVRQQS